MKLLAKLKQIKKSFSNYQPVVEVLIYKENILHNIRQFQRLAAGVKVAPVLKSNAYGHGLKQLAEILQAQPLPFVIVDSLFEARALRSYGCKHKILVIGFTTTDNILRNKLKDIAFTISEITQLSELADHLSAKILIHLKIDTGMHRQGILIKDIARACQLIQKNKNLSLEGICSHLADADTPNSIYTQQQITSWQQAVKQISANFPQLKYKHLAATAGSAYLPEIDCNVLRLGIGLYGFNVAPAINLQLKPALEVKSIVSSVKEIALGGCVGYNCTFKAPKSMKIATIPMGYFEGVDRRLSNSGFMKVSGQDCQIIGRVSMNITTIDVSNLVSVKIGDPVLVISAKPDEHNSVVNIAKLCQTIPYEILVHIAQHLKRTII